MTYLSFFAGVLTGLATITLWMLAIRPLRPGRPRALATALASAVVCAASLAWYRLGDGRDGDGPLIAAAVSGLAAFASLAQWVQASAQETPTPFFLAADKIRSYIADEEPVCR